MTDQNFFELAGYFANPIRSTRIEIEAKEDVLNGYKIVYKNLTGDSLPIGTDSVVKLPNSADKWGREMRLYFSLTEEENTPLSISKQMTGGGRPGYDTWNKRLNSRDIIDRLFEYGFKLGDIQDLDSIQSLIPVEFETDFQRGFRVG